MTQGAALCLLLDRLSPGWQERSDRQPALTIVELMDAALRGRDAAAAAFSEAEAAGFQARAAASIADLGGRRRRLRAELLERQGSRVVIEVMPGAEPFRVQRFDPINLMVLDAGAIAHANYLSLAVPQGTVELTNPGFVRGSVRRHGERHRGRRPSPVERRRPAADDCRHPGRPEGRRRRGDGQRGGARCPTDTSRLGRACRRRTDPDYREGAAAVSVTYRYHHVGIPAAMPVEGMTRLDHLRIACTDHESNPFGIQWMCYDADCPVPPLVRDVAHVAFEVDDLAKALAGKKVHHPAELAVARRAGGVHRGGGRTGRAAAIPERS